MTTANGVDDMEIQDAKSGTAAVKTAAFTSCVQSVH